MEIYKAVPFQQVALQNGFWHQWQRRNSEVTIYSVYKQYENTGRFASLRFDWKEGMPDKPHFFWDSDVAKWIESAAFILEKKKDSRLEEIIDGLVGLLEKNQDENGYFNVYFTVCEPNKRFVLRTYHELYCAGHLFEAAVAYARATGKEKFLHLMCRYADHIEKVFKIDRTAGYYTPGHEEIELALVKLYHYTGEKRYLELSQWFVEERGRHDDEFTYDGMLPCYDQHEVPVRELKSADGHAVRALYLYCAMADLAYEYHDGSMLDACRRLFENITRRRMYITGGIGSAREGEAFTIDHDLPNLTAYAESCAAIGLILFCRRLLLCELDSRYADVAERVLYNGFLSGISLDGKRFFYENPLEIVPELLNRDASMKKKRPLPLTQRVEVFNCSCCPPNITRIIASLGDLLYTHSDDTLFVHHFIDSTTNVTLGNAKGTVVQKTAYPKNGNVLLQVSGLEGKRIAVRIPGWCKKAVLKLDGAPVSLDMLSGYAMTPITGNNIALELNLDMPVVLTEASPLVREDAGKVAVMRGPIVYCAEAMDNGPCLWALAVDTANPSICMQENDLFPFDTIVLQGYRRLPTQEELYYPVTDGEWEPQPIRLIPYFAFANREETEMAVWLNKR